MISVLLDAKRKSILFEIQTRRPGFSCQGSLGEFIDDYLVAESLLRRLISYYASDTSNAASENMKTAQISAALRHFGLTPTESDIIDAFQGGQGIRGFKSARQLRNGFLHSLNAEDRLEIANKSALLKALLQRVMSPLVLACSGA